MFPRERDRDAEPGAGDAGRPRTQEDAHRVADHHERYEERDLEQELHRSERARAEPAARRNRDRKCQRGACGGDARRRG